MPVTTKPSPSQVGRNGDWNNTVRTDDKNFSRSVFDILTKNCRSPYENDRNRPGYTPAKGRRGRGRGRARSGLGHESRDHFEALPLIASSLDSTSPSAGNVKAVTTYSNGFVNGLIRAFNQDLHLIVRPDDVWQAIVSQFSLFVNGNAERLRHLFVAHRGKHALTIDLTPTDLNDIDFGAVAQKFVTAIQANVVDAELKQWMLPDFSTTTDHDRAVAAFGAMGALQKYFSFGVACGCGLPSVTLLGERADWVALADRVEKLPRYGDECARWAEMLRVVMRHFLLTFDEPDSPEVHDFWLRVAHEAGSEGSGMGLHSLSGWITAFAYFTRNGRVATDYRDFKDPYRGKVERKPLLLDGVEFPLVRLRSIPNSVITLPMKIQDFKAQVTRFTTVISGNIGMAISKGETTAQPFSAWWIVQEFEQPLGKEVANAGSSVTGSTTDEMSEGCSVSEKSFSEIDK